MTEQTEPKQSDPSNGTFGLTAGSFIVLLGAVLIPASLWMPLWAQAGPVLILLSGVWLFVTGWRTRHSDLEVQ